MLWRILLYLGFILVAAPIDSVLVVWSGLVNSDQAQLFRPLADALIYIYAFILAVETLFRIEQHHDILALKPWLRITQIIAGIVIILFIIDYMNVVRPKVEAHSSALDSATRQIFVAVFAVIASVLSFIACES